MNKQFLKTLNRLCGEVEALQARAESMKNGTDKRREIYECIADAKNELLDAIRIAEGA